MNGPDYIFLGVFAILYIAWVYGVTRFVEKRYLSLQCCGHPERAHFDSGFCGICVMKGGKCGAEEA